MFWILLRLIFRFYHPPKTHHTELCFRVLKETNQLSLSLFVSARQAVKNTPKRLPSVTVRSPLGASPPALDSQTESSTPTPPMDTGVTASDDTSIHSVVRTYSKHVFVCLLHSFTGVGYC